MAGKPHMLSDGQKSEVAKLLWKQILSTSLVVLALLGGITGLSLWGIKCRLENKLEALVTEQFREPRIQAVVSNVAAHKAEALLLTQIMPEVEKFKTETAVQVVRTEKLVSSTQDELRKLSSLINVTYHDAQTSITNLEQQVEHLRKMEQQLQSALDNAQKTLSVLCGQSEFTLVVLSAQTDDRAAYDKLVAWSKNPDHPLHDYARKVQTVIQRSYVGWMGNKPFIEFRWNDGVDPYQFTLPQIEGFWQTVPEERAPGFVEYVWGHTNLTKEAKLSFLHRVLNDSRNSLQAADKAGRFLSEEGKVKYNSPFDFSQLDKWWAERSTNQVLQNSANPH